LIAFDSVGLLIPACFAASPNVKYGDCAATANRNARTMGGFASADTPLLPPSEGEMN
jgi:hypothetical protein